MSAAQKLTTSRLSIDSFEAVGVPVEESSPAASSAALAAGDAIEEGFVMLEDGPPIISGQLSSGQLQNALESLDAIVVHELYFPISVDLKDFWKDSVRPKIAKAKSQRSDRVFIPMVLERSRRRLHFSEHIVLTTINLSERTIEYYDPKGVDVQNESRSLKEVHLNGEKLTPLEITVHLARTLSEDGQKWKIKSSSAHHQGTLDNENCGVFVYEAIRNGGDLSRIEKAKPLGLYSQDKMIVRAEITSKQS